MLLTDAVDPALGRGPCWKGCSMTLAELGGLGLAPDGRFPDAGDSFRTRAGGVADAAGGAGPGGGRIPPTGVPGRDRELGVLGRGCAWGSGV